MNPYYDEQRLRNEVIFLHSLWHQGPPQPPPTPNPILLSFPTPQNQNPLSSSSSFQPFPHHHHQHHRTLTPFAPSHTRSLPPIAPTTTFNKHNNKRKETERKPGPGPEWLCSDLPNPPETTTTGWSPLKKPCSAPAPTMSLEEKEKLSAIQAQNKACQAFREILRNCRGDDDFEEEEDDDGEDLEEFEEFFIGVFMEDNELRRYYQKHFENGEFCCLVCDAIGKKKSGKKFKDCAGLVQHSMSILRTVKKLAHRAFGQAVCKVLGWDIDRLPTIVMKGKPLGLEQAQAEVCHESLVSRADWDCENSTCNSSSTASGWPSFNTKPSSQISSLTAEEQASVAVLQMQRKALEACQEYLVGNGGSDSDDDDNDEDEDEDEDELIDEYDSEECEEFKFFIGLFTENSDLRSYYENNNREGDFYCLVCGGLRKKMWKRFKDCIALLQHSTAIKRTKRKKAHRAYSQVICKVLGWDIGQLPAVVLKGESLGSSLARLSNPSGEPKKPEDGHIDCSSSGPLEPANSHVDNSNTLQENQAK